MNTKRNEETLLRLATAVVNDEAVDWEREASTDVAVQHQVRNLRLIHSISEAHRNARDEVLENTESLDVAQGRTWGKLRLLQRLGAGAFGEVYRAWDPDLECEVALKLPHASTMASDEQRRRFMHEARQLAKVRHENVLRVLGADEHGGRVGIWTELVEGRTFEELLGHAGRFSADEAASIGIELCRALAAVHGAGIVHRDLKTANVLREEGGRIVLLDFSTAAKRAQTLDPAHPRAPLSGTPRFMAPEQFRGEPGSVHGDLYSLGVVLYRLVTVGYPVEASTIGELARHHETGEYIPLRDRRADLPGPFVQVVEQALAADPEHRYASAGEMEQALEGTRHALAPHSPDDALRPDRTRRTGWWTAAALLTTIVAVIAYSFWPPSFEVDLSFYKLRAGGLRETITDGAPLSLGDRLFLQIQATHDSHVYVMSEDLDGRTTTMFPASIFDQSNPIAANQGHLIPGATEGTQQYWIIDTPSETEAYLVIVANKQLPGIETVMANLRTVTSDPTDGMTLRGSGRAGPAPGIKPDGQRIFPDLLEDLATLAEQDSGVWYREIRFRGAGED